MMPILRCAEDEPFMVVREEFWLPAEPVTVPQPCPYVTTRACAFRVRPPNRHDWVRALRTLLPQRPRCILFDLPEAPINLTVEDLRLWTDEAQTLSPEVPIVLAQAGCKLPCGERAACLQCPQAAARLLQEQTADWTEREVPIAAQLRQKFPQLSEAKRALIAMWALEPSDKASHLPVQINEIAARFKVSRHTIQRWLREAKHIEPVLMQRLEAFRERRLRKTSAYVVRV